MASSPCSARTSTAPSAGLRTDTEVTGFDEIIIFRSCTASTPPSPCPRARKHRPAPGPPRRAARPPRTMARISSEVGRRRWGESDNVGERATAWTSGGRRRAAGSGGSDLGAKVSDETCGLGWGSDGGARMRRDAWMGSPMALSGWMGSPMALSSRRRRRGSWRSGGRRRRRGQSTL